MRLRRALLASAATLLFAITGAGAYIYAQRNVYITAVGEQRSILLSDGSTIDLNARSKIRIQLDEHTRHIALLEGQALFHVAKDKTRPFIVAASGTLVRAVGTEFDVNRRKRGLIVTVVEGTVSVSSDDPRNSERSDLNPESSKLLVSAGEQIVVTQASELKSRNSPFATAAATAWTQRRLIFDSTPLSDVAEEFNRNTTRPLIIEGEGLEDFHISGAFSSTDLEPLLRFLRTQTGIQITEQRDRIVVSRSR